VKGANLSAETVTAASHLDSVVSTLLRNFSAGSSDFFKVLVKVFQPALLSEEHRHLQYFHMIVPALCLAWIDASLQAKDAMLKKTSRTGGAREMYFTDDGFPMGVAYCLAILKQVCMYLFDIFSIMNIFYSQFEWLIPSYSLI